MLKGLMTEETVVTLQCCGNEIMVALNHLEAPALEQGHFRKNIGCPYCGKLVILDAKKLENGKLEIEQEIIEI